MARDLWHFCEVGIFVLVAKKDVGIKMRPGHVRRFSFLPNRRELLCVLAVGLVLSSVFACKKTEADGCEKACSHATSVVLDMVAAQGTLNSKALTERSEEMQRSCQAECREGGLDPECLASAANYGALQKCSLEALNTPADTKSAVPVAPQPEAIEGEAPGETRKKPASPNSQVDGQSAP